VTLGQKRLKALALKIKRRKSAIKTDASKNEKL